MTTLNLNLPNSIQRDLQEMADLEGVSIDQFITSAVGEKISALTAQTYLQTRADRAEPAAIEPSRRRFERFWIKFLSARH